MLKILRIVLPIIVFVLAGYSLLSGNHEVMPYMMFFMGAMLLVMGIAEIKDARKKMGVICINVSIFVFYVSVQGLLLN
ncbi:YczI family protein [Oceanobacillus longus]|uniref:YczI family protein n=1 Tax=Oceanobacillus longus TaxID=930120 RepID=A0ABV8GT19_9BACI